MTLEEFKQLAGGTKLDSIILVIKTARKPFEVNDDNGDVWWQEVVFMDATGEMPGEIFMGSYTPESGTKNENRAVPHNVWRSKQKIYLVNGEIQDADIRGKEGKKIKVFEARDMAPQLTFDQYNDISHAETQSQLVSRDDEIRGKIRHGIVCAMIKSTDSGCDWPSPKPETKKFITSWVDYIMTGE